MLAGLTGCFATEDGRPTVVVTTNILGDITREVVGDGAEVKVLMKPNADPHSFGVSAAEAAQIESADLVVYNGLGLEENVLRHVEAAKEAGVPTLGVARRVHPLSYRTDKTAGRPDPHFWTDPSRVRTAVRLIGDAVAEHVDGVDKSAVKEQATAYGKQIGQLGTWMEQRFETIPKSRRKLVTNHHVFGYLARRFDFQVVGTVIPSGTTLASPSAADMEALTTTIEKAGVKAIFADSSQPDRLARALKKESDVEVAVIPLFSESLTEEGKGAATYLQMMRANTKSIVRGLAKS
ncbi:zinc ABC transporter substrate-binding protein [Streptomyces sp. A73]|uniref:zinc ABC transporter substrate-binding protein AztC n=1 Tax=Streptomyces TaxID=1883 RepID=UPI000C19C5BC|nr:zinc ABC transporter substrate-binding protein AztC [Streptomyces sp. RK75]MBQ0863638.1 zinc ABC transporter substrate-binding protein [Streptomyces sp. RK75]MBQ1158228.1 zinc ABC transporter substrate-binding protein [Streptomyces sp. A73]